MEPRQARALHIAATTALAPDNGRWKVPSQSGNGRYTAKFGDTLLGKTAEAQDNEVLAKVIAHNLCVLIQSFYELGIEADFQAA